MSASKSGLFCSENFSIAYRSAVRGIRSVSVGYQERHPKTRATLLGKTLETGATFGFGLNLPLRKFNTSLPFVLQFDFASAPQNSFVEDY